MLIIYIFIARHPCPALIKVLYIPGREYDYYQGQNGSPESGENQCYVNALPIQMSLLER